MNRVHAMNPPVSPFVLGLLAASLLALSACESVSRAPKGSPRVEVEVAVTVAPSVADELQVAEEEIVREMTDIVMQRADIGLRFYPVLSSDYGTGDQRPDLLMTVVFQDLDVPLDERTVRKGDADADAEPQIELVPGQVSCGAMAKLERRRPSGPALTVARAEGTGRTGVRRLEEGDARWMLVHPRQAEHPVALSPADVSKAASLALQDAFAQMVKAIDRELSLQGGGGGGAPESN